MVVVRRLNSFVFWLIFITLIATARESAAEGTVVLSEAGDVGLVTNIQKDNTEAVSTLKESSFEKLEGRKMMINKKVFGKENVIMHMNIEKEIIVEAEVTKISGANNVGNSSHGHDKGKAKMIKVMKMRAKISTTTSEPVDVKNEDLFAFSADYHMAKSHPPKNN